MCAVRSDRTGDATSVLHIGRWVGWPRPSAPANDNGARSIGMATGERALAIGLRLTLCVSGLGILAATACLFVAA